MINVLIADNDINYAINIMNCINIKNQNIKICNIAKDGKEVLELLNKRNNIDIILLNYNLPIYNAHEILNNMIYTDKYKNSFIILSKKTEKMELFNKIYSKLIYSIIYKTAKIDNVVKEINKLFEYKDFINSSEMLENKILDELLYLGYDISHKGTKYLKNTIEYIVLNPDSELEILERDVYPKVAIIYNDSVHNIKCRINAATNTMYYNCKIEKLKEYFNFDIDTKPKVKTIITTIINKIS